MNERPVHVHGPGGRCSVYVGITAREAVMAAHAQSLGDYNTWDYERHYGALAVETPTGWRCVDSCHVEWRGGQS